MSNHIRWKRRPIIRRDTRRRDTIYWSETIYEAAKGVAAKWLKDESDLRRFLDIHGKSCFCYQRSNLSRYVREVHNMIKLLSLTRKVI